MTGKTETSLRTVLSEAKAGNSIVYVTEANELDLTYSLLSIESGISEENIKTENLTRKQWQSLNRAVGTLGSLDIKIQGVQS